MADSNEADKVYQEVERRRLSALELGVHKLICDVWQTIRHYPAWVSSCPDYVCASVTDISKHGEAGVCFTMRDRKYALEFTRRTNYLPDGGEDDEYANLTLFCGSNKVLTVGMMNDRWDRNWTACSIDAFVEGDWIDAFRSLKNDIENQVREREKRQRNDPDTINELKKDFGIE